MDHQLRRINFDSIGSSAGCIRVVRYTAGTMGFQPTVTYEGDGCQPADSADNRLTGTGPEDPAEQDPSQKSVILFNF